MIENWVSQVVSSLGFMYNKSINKVLHRMFLAKCCYSSNNLCEYCWFFVCDFWSQNCAHTTIPKSVDTFRPKIHHNKNDTLDTGTLSVLS